MEHVSSLHIRQGPRPSVCHQVRRLRDNPRRPQTPLVLRDHDDCLFRRRPWHRILGATRVRDKVSLWQNGSAQWNDLIELGWLTKWITVHSRPMDWAEGQFNESGRPICNKPIGHHPERRIVRGGVLDTRKWLLDVQPNGLPDYPAAREEPVEQETPLFKFGPPGVGGTPADDPFRDHNVSPLGPPPAPKRLRSESEDKAYVPKAPWMEPKAPGVGGTPAILPWLLRRILRQFMLGQNSCE